MKLVFDALNIFEEIRFIVELVLAEQLFMWFFAKRKRHFWSRSLMGWGVFLVLSVAYSLVYSNDFINGFVRSGTFIVWYVLLTLGTLILLKYTYAITLSDALFIGIAGYSLQHIDYIAINELLARGLWPSLTESLWLYGLICIVSTAVLYYAMIKIFAQKLRASGGVIYEDKWQTVVFFLLMLIVLFVTAFLGQHMYLDGTTDYSRVNYLGAVYDFFSCLLVLVVQYSIFRISTLNREKEIVKQLLYERQKQYAMSRENIEIINHKCHDLKHQIQGLKAARGEELDRYIEEVEGSVMFYDSVLKTDNEVVNTILTEKSLYCEKHGIRMSCIIDAAYLDFMSTLDIYSLLGNALDNAIEAAGKQVDMERRVVSLNISTKGNFLSIQTNNYYEGEIPLRDGLPMTTKRRYGYHGFGIQSMKHLAEKYGGTLTVSGEKQIFLLQIVIPVPAEFVRLLKEKESGGQ